MIFSRRERGKNKPVRNTEIKPLIAFCCCKNSEANKNQVVYMLLWKRGELINKSTNEINKCITDN